MKKKMNFVKCNLCGKDDCEVYIRSLCVGDQDKSRKFATTSNYVGSENIVKCKNCGLIYVNPQIEQKEIIEGYTNADEKYYVKEEKARSNTFKACLKQVENYSKKGKMLDVGCAAGFFLKLAKDSGWEVCGVEPNKWLVNWGKKKFGIDIRNGSFEKMNFKKGYFDVVTLWDVLEHLADPRGSLMYVNKILKKDGLLVVNYPDIGSWPAKIFGKKWWFILSVHLYYFAPRTIKRILKETGFKVVKIKPHIQSLSFGYLILRMKPYSKITYGLLSKFANMFGLNSLNIPYYAGQTMVIAERSKT